MAIGEGSVSSTAGGVAGYVPPPADAAQTASIAATTSTTGSFAVGSAADGVYRQITGVAAGTADSDAVNVAQLKAVQGSIAAAATHYYSVNDGGTQQANYNNDGATGVNSMASGAGAASSGTSAVAVGHNSNAAGNQSVAIGSGASASLANNVALGSGSTDKAAVQVTSATVTNDQGASQTYGGFAGTASGVVSVGAAGSERQIVNVAPGAITSNSTDAVNGSQLYAVAKGIDNRVTNIDNRVTNVEAEVGDLRREMRGGVAAAAAMVTITPVEPGKSHVNLEVATHKGEYGVGVSWLKRSENGRWTANAGAGWGSGGAGAIVRAGIGFTY